MWGVRGVIVKDILPEEPAERCRRRRLYAIRAMDRLGLLGEENLIPTLSRRPALRWLADEWGARWGVLTELGQVNLEIVALAKEIGASLIVMGCRGHRRIWRTIEGRSSDGVIRCAPYPVLVVRSHQGAEAPERPVFLRGGGR